MRLFGYSQPATPAEFRRTSLENIDEILYIWGQLTFINLVFPHVRMYMRPDSKLTSTFVLCYLLRRGGEFRRFNHYLQAVLDPGIFRHTDWHPLLDTDGIREDVECTPTTRPVTRWFKGLSVTVSEGDREYKEVFFGAGEEWFKDNGVEVTHRRRL